MGEMSLPMSYNGGLGMKTALQEENGFSCTLLDYITFIFYFGDVVCSTWIS